MRQKFLEDSLIILTKPTLDVFLNQTNPMDLISLYILYYYTAKWQKTNQIHATTGYISKGAGWSRERVIQTKKKLIELGFIEDVRRQNSKTGKLEGWYIKINYLINEQKIHPTEKPEGGFTHRVENSDINALSNNNINALSNDNKNVSEAETPDVVPQSVFNLNDELQKLIKSPRREIGLIGEYLQEKNVKISSSEQLKVAIRRHLRAAKELSKFPDDKIGHATVIAEKEYPSYTLETLVKILTR